MLLEEMSDSLVENVAVVVKDKNVGVAKVLLVAETAAVVVVYLTHGAGEAPPHVVRRHVGARLRGKKQRRERETTRQEHSIPSWARASVDAGRRRRGASQSTCSPARPQDGDGEVARTLARDRSRLNGWPTHSADVSIRRRLAKGITCHLSHARATPQTPAWPRRPSSSSIGSWGGSPPPQRSVCSLNAQRILRSAEHDEQGDTQTVCLSWTQS